MAATFTFYNSLRKNLSNGAIDIDGDTFKATLHTSTYVPDAETQTVYADLTNELSTANGYTSGGVALTSVTWTQSTVIVTFDADDVTWLASGSGLVARYLVVRSTSTTLVTEPLVFWLLMDDTPLDVTTPAGYQLLIQWPSTGVFTQA